MVAPCLIMMTASPRTCGMMGDQSSDLLMGWREYEMTVRTWVVVEVVVQDNEAGVPEGWEEDGSK